jgi:hypothetical protein
MVGTLLKSHKMRMSPEKQETLLKLSILSLAAILCKYIGFTIHVVNVLMFPSVHISVHYSVSFLSSLVREALSKNLGYVGSDLTLKVSKFGLQNLLQVL